jgi:hypothetical protein
VLCSALQQGHVAWALSHLPSLQMDPTHGPAASAELCSCLVAACCLSLSPSGIIVASPEGAAEDGVALPVQMYPGLLLASVQVIGAQYPRVGCNSCSCLGQLHVAAYAQLPHNQCTRAT